MGGDGFQIGNAAVPEIGLPAFGVIGVMLGVFAACSRGAHLGDGLGQDVLVAERTGRALSKVFIWAEKFVGIEWVSGL